MGPEHVCCNATVEVNQDISPLELIRCLIGTTVERETGSRKKCLGKRRPRELLDAGVLMNYATDKQADGKSSGAKRKFFAMQMEEKYEAAIKGPDSVELRDQFAALNDPPVTYNGAGLWKTGRMRAMHQRLGSQGVSDRRHLH